MRIGIITQPLHNNYGGLLQNFALQQVLRDSGHNPITIEWKGKSASSFKEKLFEIKLLLKDVLFHDINARRKRYKLTPSERAIISRNTSRFISEFITHTAQIDSSEGFLLESKKNEVEALVAGSDQVWRLRYSGGHIYDMFFKFAEQLNVKRIAYAASFGLDCWEFTPEQTRICSRLAHKFDLITVREESAVILCEKQLGVNAIHVLDPTMLHDKSIYEKIVKYYNVPRSNGSLFHYILDPSDEKNAFIKEIGNKQNLVPFTVMPIYQAETRTRDNIKNEIEQCVFPGVENWLRAFMDAEMVICDSFHGCVFSIIFNKPFWAIANAQRGNTRFNSLLHTFGLEDRLISTSKLNCIDINKPIDWQAVNSTLEVKRQFSKDLLLHALT